MEPSFTVERLSMSSIRACTYRPTPVRRRIPPISRLSEDLLGYILDICSSDGGPRSGRVLANTARFTAQVNRQWRAVALSHKLIWLGPALNWFSSHQWVDEVLRRSDPLPLDVIIPFDAAKRNPQVVLNALKHVSRIRTLELELLSHWWLFVMDSRSLQQKAPQLERFSLSINQGFDRRRQCTPEPQNMFGGYAPRLQHFQIHDCSMNLNPETYRSLRALVIDKMQYIPVFELMNILSHMKCLEKLHVIRAPDNAVFPDIYMPSAHIPDVHLLNLSELMVSATLPACASIMRSLVIPPSCSMEIDAHDAQHEGRDIMSLLGRITESLTNWRCDSLTGRQSLHFGVAEVGYSFEGPPEDGVSHREHPFIGLTLSWYQRSSQVDQLFSLFPLLTAAFRRCQEPPNTLSILASNEMPHLLSHNVRHMLEPWLHKMDYIQAIEFQNHQTFVLMETLLRGSDCNILLPHMGDIVFFNVNFVTQKKRCWRRLVDILRFREHAEAPVLQVDFVDCVGEFRGENIPGRFGTAIKINGRDCSDEDDDDGEGEDSDYTVQGLSD